MTEWEHKCLTDAANENWNGLYGIGIRLNDKVGNFIGVADIMKTDWFAATTTEQQLEVIQKAISNAS